MRRHPAAAVVVSLALLLGLGAIPASGQDTTTSSSTPQSQVTEGLEEARAAADKATQDYADAEVALAEAEDALAEAESRLADTEAEVTVLEKQVRDVAVRRYMSDDGLEILDAESETEMQTREAVLETVADGDVEVLEALEASKADAEAQRTELAEQKAEKEAILLDLGEARERIDAELATLEKLEAERLEAERKRKEEEARKAAEEAEKQKALEALALLTRLEEAKKAAPVVAVTAPSKSASSSASPGKSTPPTTPATPPSVPSTPIATGDWICPVQGPVSFIDSWGAPRSGGRRHKGVDMMSSRGTPVVAPVSGRLEHRGNSLGGMSFHLYGDDGTYYYGTHMSAYANQGIGHVEAGTLVGYVGDTGNARGMPHLHFEIHPGGPGHAVNPYPTTKAACG